MAFDWDGTAVPDRQADASAIRHVVEALLKLEIPVVAITGTHLENLDRQFSVAIQGPHKRSLFLCTNRGSEVWGFHEAGRPELLYRREATPREDRLLTEVAEAVRDRLVNEHGLAVRVIYNRFNRRKIDLIPLPEWRDPPKDRISDLLAAVQARLHQAGIAGGLAEVVQMALEVAKEKGMPDARITSDAKHVEIGLTDKSDSMLWVWRELARRQGIPAEEVLVGGDEFGTLGGVGGSDACMRVPELAKATYVSVGVEPEGVPDGVVQLGGGPVRFVSLLNDQVKQHATGLPIRMTDDPAWLLIEEGLQAPREHEIESLFAVSNGLLGTRASLAETSAMSRPGTFMRGVYQAAQPVPRLLRLPDWSGLHLEVGGQRLQAAEGCLIEQRRVLDLKQGIQWREWRHRDDAGRITWLRSLRLASLADRHFLIQSLVLEGENYSDTVVVRSYSTGGSWPFQAVAREGDIVVTATLAHAKVALGWRATLTEPSGHAIQPYVNQQPDRMEKVWQFPLKLDRRYRFDRLAAAFVTEGSQDPAELVIKALDANRQTSLRRLLVRHVAAWEVAWQRSAVSLEGDDDAQKALRFAIYHLNALANPHDPASSIGARALSGEGYRGHVFWDTEVYLLPFYSLTDPASARCLLLYRFHTLPAAKRKASGMGYQGALYAWESTDSGDEAAPRLGVAPNGRVVPILSGLQEHHVSAAVAYATWHYWQWTGDETFLEEAGAEILIETARFWASRGRLEADGHFHIRGVMGPDEYHPDVDDNAYTNGMARWNLENAAEMAHLFAERWPPAWQKLCCKLSLDDEEIQSWRRLARAMWLPVGPNGLMEQFQGYFDLPSTDLERAGTRSAMLGSEMERIRHSQVTKQADVVLLLALLWDQFSPTVRQANFDYYLPRTVHGSSLSPAIYAWVAARLGKWELASSLFKQAAEIDLSDNMGNAAGGVHIGAMGGLWQAIVFGMAGLALHSSGLSLEPKLLPDWQELAFPVTYRGHQIRIALCPDRISWRHEGPGGLGVVLGSGTAQHLHPNVAYEVHRAGTGWGPWKEVGR